MGEISNKQLEANRNNAKLGGVKTEAGKQKTRYNAVKHNLLTNLLSEKEAKEANSIKIRLQQQFEPANVMEEMLVERIAIWSVRLQRAVIAEAEQMRKIDNPRVVEEIDHLPIQSFVETKVINEGYTPKIKSEDVEMLAGTLFRYESSIERNLYKALHELQRLQAERSGQEVPPPLAVDVEIGGK